MSTVAVPHQSSAQCLAPLSPDETLRNRRWEKLIIKSILLFLEIVKKRACLDKKNESCNTFGIITFVLIWSEWGDSFAFVPRAAQIIERANIRAGAVTCHRQVTTELRVSLCMKKCRRGTNRSCIFGPSGETRTPGILLPNNVKRFFLVIYSAFSCFSVGFRYSLGIYKSAFHRCSGTVCGHLCGQKRFPP